MSSRARGVGGSGQRGAGPPVPALTGLFRRWLGIAAAGGPEKPGCSSPPLSPGQQELCRQKPELVPAIREGARLGLQECRSQFRHERWDCRPPPAAPRRPPAAFGQQLSSGECRPGDCPRCLTELLLLQPVVILCFTLPGMTAP